MILLKRRLFVMLISVLLFGAVGNAQTVTKLTLINSDNNTDIRELKAQDTIDLAQTGISLNIRADVSGTVGSVRFMLNGAVTRTESAAPYALGGDTSGDYWVWTPPEGANTISATAYTEAGGSGNAGTPLSVQLFVKNSGGTGGEGDVYDLPANSGTGDVTISGQLKKWHKVTLSFDGPAYAETDVQPSPFLDYRLNVTFTNGTKTYVVPGYFAADGNAAETSAQSGNVWRAHFAPDEIGEWTYTASFRLGGYAAVSEDAEPGIAVAPIDGATGTFTIEASDKTGRDNRAKGRLQYVNSRYLKYAETGNIFIKGGADAPENFLAYEDFDNTPDKGGYRKSWAPHAGDYNTGDPSWQGGKGTEIIGAVNYLASEGLNVFSFLTMNINGDDKNVYPYLSTNSYTQFDCSKLDQWEIVFAHGDSLGMYLHFKTQETENEMLLDNGNTGTNRKLYYRELVARFGHHLALNWNLGEENGDYGATNQNTAQRIAMAAYFNQIDPYNHHIVLHTAPSGQDAIYPPLLGSASEITGASVQVNWAKVHEETGQWVLESAAAGKPWVVANDEQGGANIGVPEDAYTGTPNKHDIREQTLWGNLMAGGAGVEYYFGYERPESDLNCQDYRSRDESWDYVRYAIEFFETKPLEDMAQADGLVSSGWCLANPGANYIVYLRNGGTATLTLADEEVYYVKWYNPRTGAGYEDGSVTTISGVGAQSLGNAPSETTEDWAVYVYRDFGSNQMPTASFSFDEPTGQAPVEISFDATASGDPDGTIASYEWDFGDGIVGTGQTIAHTFSQGGTFKVTLKVTDNEGGFARTSKYVTVERASTSSCGERFDVMSKDFPYSGTGFYLDSYTDYDLLAITPTPPNPATASVTTSFTGETCNYNVVFHAVGENDGQSEFKVSVAGQLLGTFVVPLSTESWEVGEAYNFTWEGVTIANGDDITVEGKTASNDTEWSRARWLKIEFVPSGCVGGFAEEDGLLIMEAEDIELATGWEYKTEDFPGYTGDSYIQFTGANSMSSPNPATEMEYKFQITNPGTYQFRWRSRNGPGATKYDEENDTWLKIDADDFYGMKGTTKVDCNNHYMKVWIQNLNAWSYSSNGEHGGQNGLDIFATFNSPGEYSLFVAGRSHGHPIDRIVMYTPNRASDATNPDTPPTGNGCGGGNVQKDFASAITQSANMVAEELTIDGGKDEIWDNVCSATGTYEVDGLDLPTSTDLSFTCRVAYDTDYLYFLAEVSDDILSAYSGSAGNYDEFDNVELYFNPDGLHQEGGSYGDDALQIRMNYGVTDHSVSGNGTWKAADYNDLKYFSAQTETGYVLEAQIPWAGILPAGTTAEEGLTMGFEVQVNDRDNGTEIENKLAWANNTLQDLAGADTRKFGELLLDQMVYRYADKSGWEVIYVDSKSSNTEKEWAIDGDPSTFWHTVWHSSDASLRDPLPHEIQIDFHEVLEIAEVHYLHRQDEWGPNGAIGEYEIYVSDDPENWGDAKKVGELDWKGDVAANQKMLHVIVMDSVVSGRYLRLKALTEAQNNPDVPYTAIAELDVISVKKTMEPINAVNSIDAINHIKVYPNPTAGWFNVEVQTDGFIVIQDVVGRTVYRDEIIAGVNTVDISGQAKGLYIINTNQGGKRSAIKLQLN